MNLLVTGGAGFIGSALCRLLLAETDVAVVNLDKLTYAASPEALASIQSHPRYRFERGNICERRDVERVLQQHQPDAVIHLAAESHVDRSIDGPKAFIDTNIVGTCTLLEAVRRYWEQLGPGARERFRFHHVSTDEVYGSLGPTGQFHEELAYAPNSPYSASKASSDHLVRAWYHTYGLPALLTNCSNNYGPYQFPEKLIPLMITNAIEGEPLPVYGKGENRRDWLYVEDHARALWLVLQRGRVGEKYNIGGEAERSNLDVVQAICAILDDLQPRPDRRPHASAIAYVKDRPGHDLRYAMDAGKIRRELGWAPRQSFETGLRRTVQWYLENRAWWERIRSGRYRGERLGLSAVPEPKAAAQ